jgi:hypothetical protein
MRTEARHRLMAVAVLCLLFLAGCDSVTAPDAGQAKQPEPSGADLFDVGQDWGSQQVSTGTAIISLPWQSLGCIQPQATVSVPVPASFSTSVSQAAFPNFYAYLNNQYNKPQSVDIRNTLPKAVRMDVQILRQKNWRKGRVWLLTSPTRKTTYTYTYYTFYYARPGNYRSC